ncbi:pirin family protein [Nitrospirillum sp. BR 11164]|uniref:pirin family protein n=1 Tax=Nitrospirillum sp. BR 11164 TaxID=3104324 RepID=UPI002AFDCF43|nr:pirin family protein [Nitrospirillum sp. BR 11164]MEA1649529.1 pirin family protein [Nitrospirillum sp. BR 11164]
MSPLKTLKRLHAAYRDDIADLTTRRPLPGPALPQLSPFLFLNHHGPQVYPPNNGGLPFGPHPHRGFETVTFILEGELTHADSAGHESVIRAGGVQWMTAGRGVVHSELSPAEFRRQGGPLEILQLWVNLPARLKFADPGYTGLQRDAIPALPTPDGRGTVNLIAGSWGGATGPVPSLTGVFMSTVTLGAGGSVRFDGAAGRTVFLYVVRGAISVGGGTAPAHQLVELSLEGDAVEITAREDAVLLFGHGEPIAEPMVAHGPFVMNTREEIIAAIRDYQAGLFE